MGNFMKGLKELLTEQGSLANAITNNQVLTSQKPLFDVSEDSILQSLESEPTSLKSKTKPTGFLKLINDLRTFEDILRKNKIEQEERIAILRGIYYGTDWSLDFSVEHSQTRNFAFQRYTGKISPPQDPRPLIGSALFTNLFNSAEVSEGIHKFDFGHMVIGLDARNSFSAREVTIPSQGGTGLEISTWLGDIGGACGMLAFKRTTNPKFRAINLFHGSSYGGQVNLEGDIGAYLLARDINETGDPSGLQIKESTYISDLLKFYLPIDSKKISDDWRFRCYHFLRLIGAKYDGKKYVLTNRESLIREISDKVLAFGEWYIVVRLLSNSSDKTLQKIIDTTAFLEGAALEVSTLFVDTLIVGTFKSGGPVIATGQLPNPTPKGEPFEKYVKLKEAKDWFSEIKKLTNNQ